MPVRQTRAGWFVVILLTTGAMALAVFAVAGAYLLTALVVGGFYRATVCVAAYALLLFGVTVAWTRFADRRRR